MIVSIIPNEGNGNEASALDPVFVASAAVNTHPTLQDEVKSAAEAAGQPEAI